MKVCILQPQYGLDWHQTERFLQWELDALAQCDASMDLIVLPEASDVPCYAPNAAVRREMINLCHQRLMDCACATAKRCNAVVFVNAYHDTPTGLRNTTHAIDRNGNVVGRYYKQHLTPGEFAPGSGLDSGYSFEYEPPTIITIDGVRYGFLTCYDFYFYEYFPQLARLEPDVIIGCSHQRTDTHSALECMTAFCAYQCNAYVVRSSVSMGEDSPVGGASMIVSPDGTILTNMKSRIGMETVEIDPHEKYLKPSGFNGPLAAHWQYVERGRRPWKYRPGGSFIVPGDERMAYPRICAHRGFNAVAPENSLPAYGAAIALGAEEIELDLWPTKDDVLVSIHDNRLERLADGEGFIIDYTYEELLEFDFGVKFGEAFRGMRILTFEDVLKKFAGQAIMNVHVKTCGDKAPYKVEWAQQMIDLIRQYDCQRHVYFMTGNDNLARMLRELAPDIPCCMGGGDTEEAHWRIVDRAIEIGCAKVQLFKPHFNQEMIDKAHAHGIRCNVFWSDDEVETRKFLDMGIDTILTNDYQRIACVAQEWKKNR